ncbi:hypothetical protein BV372_08630 [Nostoc sp. T09]|uniref:hypothetical protein n=1 Tax=Nostoc sp. T09 TaxID=1932621 RepID=UPI000A3CE871|nr:hypothetical protein [Nostoc sp. T09]OUL36121.1 hypothetical protein BV372_08630 [Nostoc sp. T09]
MDFFNSFEPFFRQVSEAQRMFFNNWESTMSSMRNMNLGNLPENAEKTLQLQEELVKSSLELQEQLSRFSIDTQRKLWESYFRMLHKS